MNPDHRTPRDWLLARHAAATPQLDTLRRAALPAPEITWREFLREIFRPNRLAWRSLAAAWLLLVLFHLTHTRPARDPKTVAPSPEAVALWLNQLKSHETFAQIDRQP